MNGGECYMYNPDYCDGVPCPGNCDNCYIAEKIMEDEEDDG